MAFTRTLASAALSAALLSSSPIAGAVVITPSALGGWSPDVTGTGVTAITTAFPRNGDGSIEITLPDTSAEVDWSYTLPTPVPLSAFTTASYDYYRDAASTNPAIQAPSYAFYIDADCNSATTNDRSFLIFEPYYQTNSNAPTNTWVTSTITPSSLVWQTGIAWSSQPISAYMNGTATGGTAIRGSSCITDIVAFAGSGWAGRFHGAIDNITFSASPAGQIVSANFETRAAADATAVPTLGPAATTGLALLLAALVAAQRRRRPG